MSSKIIPLLSVRRGAEALEFYERAFGAEEKLVLNEGGSVFAMLTIGDAEFWMSDESPEHENFSPESVGGSTARMILVVGDVDAAHERAVSAGALEISPVGEANGWRSSRVKDPFGHHWEIGREL
ncbi:MAG: VOC family protein [Armatimonadetes bacterium]|nr:VOC family protein [Armatimonadota bacterium]MBS1727801.1 VOC family protein [Armatimonadota bacterium]